MLTLDALRAAARELDRDEKWSGIFDSRVLRLITDDPGVVNVPGFAPVPGEDGRIGYIDNIEVYPGGEGTVLHSQERSISL